MRLIIVGGGVGGLAVAIALRKAGHEPVVLEQAPASSPVGAGVFVTANGMKALTYLGADTHLRQVSVNTPGLTLSDLESNDTLGKIEFGTVGEERYGDGCYLTYRPDLFDALAGQVGPGDLRFGSKVLDVEVGPDGVTVQIEGQDPVTGDGVIGADGLNSSVQRSQVGGLEAEYTGFTAWRAVLSEEQAPDLFPLSSMGSTWLGPRRQIVTYPLHRGELLNVLCYLSDEVAGQESWTAGGDPEVLRAAFESACEPVREALAGVDDALLTPVYYRRPMSSWGSGRLTLLGDAAHAALPSAAQGTSMALEDAVMLGSMARRYAADGVDRVFREYEARRIPRTTKMMAMSVNNFLAFTESDPGVIAARNEAAKRVRQGDPLNERTWGWLYQYDVAAVAEKAPATGDHGLLSPSREDTERLSEAWLSI